MYYLTITVPISAIPTLAPRGWEVQSVEDGRAVVRKVAEPLFVGGMAIDDLAHPCEERGPKGPRKKKAEE